MTDNELNQQLQQANVLIDTGNHDKQVLAEMLLREIIQQASGSRFANEAQHRLVKLSTGMSASSRPVLEDTKTATELQNQWAGIHSLQHAQLASFVEKLFAVALPAGQTIAILRTEVINRLSDWINKAAETPATMRHLTDAVLVKLVTTIHGHPDFQQALQPALEKWQTAIFTQAFGEAAIAIRHALSKWEVEPAQQLLTAVCQTKVWPPALDLQREIDGVRETKKHLETLLEETPVPNDWPQIASLLERQQNLAPFLTRFDNFSKVVKSVPPSWQSRIENQWQQLLEKTNTFFRQHAESCQTLQAVRDFYQKFHRVVALTPANGLDSNWFKPAWKAYQTENDEQLLNVSSIEQLKHLHNRVLAEKDGLPEWLATELQQRAEVIFRLIPPWEAIVTGTCERDTMNLENVPVVPTALAQTVQQYQAILQQFDHALQLWDIETFLHLCQERSTLPSCYLPLAEHHETLEELAFLAQETHFDEVQQAATWWKHWRLTVVELPAHVLDQLPSFAQQLTDTAVAHQRLWFDLLDQKLADDHLASSECQTIATLLDVWQGADVSLRKYYQDFQRRAWRQTAKEYLTGQQWQSAKNALTKFKELGGDRAEFDQLSLLLELQQADVEDPVKLADLLWQQWFPLSASLRPQQIGELLYTAIQHHWQIQDEGRLSNLLELSQRLPATQRSETLNLWINWLEIEHTLAKEISPSHLLTLVKLVFAQGGRQIHEVLRAPLQRLVKQWQQSPEKQFLFAWFYHTSQQVQPPLFTEATDPLIPLLANSTQQAEQIEKRLRSLTDFGEAELASMQTRIRGEQDQWQRLQDYFTLLPFQLPKVQPKIWQPLSLLNSLLTVIDKLAQVKRDLAILEEADLREDKYQSQLLGVRHVLIAHLSGFAVQPLWRDRLEKLEGLKGVNYPFLQFKKTTIFFGQEDTEYSSPTLANMQGYIKDLIDLFEQTGFVERGMWQQLSKECWHLLCEEGGVWLSVPDPPDLRALRDTLQTLAQEEKQFIQQLAVLYQEAQATHVAPGSVGLKVEQPLYQTFFAAFPKEAPKTTKCYRLFDQNIRVEPLATLLKQERSLDYLPQWAIRNIPYCAPESRR
jgi:acyl carrier protein